MDSIVLPLLRFAGRPEEASIVRVVSLRGFGLRDAADGAIVTSNRVEGSVLGGLADEAIVEAFGRSERRTVLRVNVTDEVADGAGMVCGGSARLLLGPLDEIPALWRSAIERAEPVVLVSALDGTSDLVVTAKERAGSVGLDADGPTDEDAVALGRELLRGGVTTTAVHTRAGTEIVFSALVPAARARIVGSGAMAEAIAAQGDLLGWNTTIDESLDDGLRFCETAGPADALIILSHDPAVDTPLLDAALGSSIGYVGAMGSRGTQSNRRKRLIELGHEPASFDRIHGPVGLDLGARSPAETAVSIVAEYLVVRSGRSPVPLTHTSGPING